MTSKRSKFPAIVLTAGGLHFKGGENQRVEWSAVRRIKAHKLDLLTTDEIRLVFEYDGSQFPFEVSEEQPGFEQFRRFVEERFEIPQAWDVVAKPTFATNETVLYIRAEQAFQPIARKRAPAECWR